MVGHSKWNSVQVHIAVSKTSPEHLYWAVAEHKQTKGRIEKAPGPRTAAQMCPICPSIAQAEALKTKLTPKFNQVQKWQFFSAKHFWLCLVWCTQSKEQSCSELGCAFSQAHLLYFGCRTAFSQQIGALYRHLMVRMLSWEVGCGLGGPVSEEPHTLQAMGIKGKEKLKTSSFMTNGSHCQEWVWGHNFPPAFISETPGIAARVTFHPDDFWTRMKTDVQCCFALELPSGIKVT